MAKRSPITKSRQKIIIFIALAIIIGATFFSLRNYSNPSIIVINSLSKIYSVQYISSNTLFVGGVYFNSTYSQGVAGLYYLNNDTFVPFPLSKYFKGGIVYTAFFNGSSYIIGGSTVISNQLHTSLIEIYPDGLIKNISDILSPFYSIGQVFSVSWNNNYKYWLVGGTAYVLINTNQSYLIPFLIKIYANGTYKDLTPELPEQFKILGSSEIYSISFSPDGSLAMIAGSNVINMTASIYNNTNFTEVKFGYLPLGVLFSTG